ncbi:helix-turn-helix domain-containing protein [Prescottella equi]|uniref:helix-turn-helix domain-containing protein n=1 Tax=Rhodococcus hoagii TaxID=43767 RepID=UPI000A11523C|nr:helix-turn-helix domain-containing protein [Prescottella equi]ORL15390.1 hypothetical protein A6I85_05805 [Prescottella equi]
MNNKTPLSQIIADLTAADGNVTQKYLSVNQAAEYLGVDHQTVRRLIGNGQLEAVRFGTRTIRIRIDSLAAALTPVGA